MNGTFTCKLRSLVCSELCLSFFAGRESNAPTTIHCLTPSTFLPSLYDVMTKLPPGALPPSHKHLLCYLPPVVVIPIPLSTVLVSYNHVDDTMFALLYFSIPLTGLLAL